MKMPTKMVRGAGTKTSPLSCDSMPVTTKPKGSSFRGYVIAAAVALAVVLLRTDSIAPLFLTAIAGGLLSYAHLEYTSQEELLASLPLPAEDLTFFGYVAIGGVCLLRAARSIAGIGVEAAKMAADGPAEGAQNVSLGAYASAFLLGSTARTAGRTLGQENRAKNTACFVVTWLLAEALIALESNQRGEASTGERSGAVARCFLSLTLTGLGLTQLLLSLQVEQKPKPKVVDDAARFLPMSDVEKRAYSRTFLLAERRRAVIYTTSAQAPASQHRHPYYSQYRYVKLSGQSLCLERNKNKPPALTSAAQDNCAAEKPAVRVLRAQLFSSRFYGKPMQGRQHSLVQLAPRGAMDLHLKTEQWARRNAGYGTSYNKSALNSSRISSASGGGHQQHAHAGQNGTTSGPSLSRTRSNGYSGNMTGPTPLGKLRPRGSMDWTRLQNEVLNTSIASTGPEKADREDVNSTSTLVGDTTGVQQEVERSMVAGAGSAAAAGYEPETIRDANADDMTPSELKRKERDEENPVPAAPHSWNTAAAEFVPGQGLVAAGSTEGQADPTLTQTPQLVRTAQQSPHTASTRSSSAMDTSHFSDNAPWRAANAPLSPELPSYHDKQLSPGLDRSSFEPFSNETQMPGISLYGAGPGPGGMGIHPAAGGVNAGAFGAYHAGANGLAPFADESAPLGPYGMAPPMYMIPGGYFHAPAPGSGFLHHSASLPTTTPTGVGAPAVGNENTSPGGVAGSFVAGLSMPSSKPAVQQSREMADEVVEAAGEKQSENEEEESGEEDDTPVFAPKFLGFGGAAAGKTSTSIDAAAAGAAVGGLAANPALENTPLETTIADSSSLLLNHSGLLEPNSFHLSPEVNQHDGVSAGPGLSADGEPEESKAREGFINRSVVKKPTNLATTPESSTTTPLNALAAPFQPGIRADKA
mmetsp:Transcript_18842/g.47108  ORF Transcript_18842/g.47108 Transcript_18842/m.47108 type:complete len:925 (+) Transcript_18842:81-2855(+)